MNLRAVDGSSIACSFELQDSDGLQKAMMKFQVAGVVRPVASVSELLSKGFEVHFVGGQGWMAKNGRMLEFIGEATVSYCRCLELGETASGTT